MSTENTVQWRHKDLLDIEELNAEEIMYLLDEARQLDEINSRAVKKGPTLSGK